MAAGQRARRVDQRRLETAPVSEGPALVPTAEPQLVPGPVVPPEPTVPADGSGAALRRRQLAWLTERRRFEDATASPGATPAPPEDGTDTDASRVRVKKTA